MSFNSLNLSGLVRLSAEMASCFLTLAQPNKGFPRILDLIEVTFPQHQLPIEIVRQLLQLLLPQQLLLQGHLSKVLLLLQLHPGLINIMGSLTLWRSIWSLPELSQPSLCTLGASRLFCSLSVISVISNRISS